MYIRRPLCAFSMFFVLLLWLVLSAADWNKDDTPYMDSSSEVADYEGTVNHIENKEDQIIIHIKNISQIIDYTHKEKLKYRGIRIYLNSSEEDKIRMGATVVVHGKLSDFKAANNRGQYDMRMHYSLRKIDKVIYNATIIGISSSYNAYTDGLYRIKRVSDRIFEEYLSDKESGVAKALVLGDKNDLDENIKQQYQNAGISHILALSGLHIATLGLMLYGLLCKMRLNRKVAAVLASVIMISYAIMTGMSTSTVRALIMFLLGIIASFLKRTYDIRTGAAIAADLILIENPYYIYDSGFLLSFGAVMGIAFIYPNMIELINMFFRHGSLAEYERSDRYYMRCLIKLIKTIVLSISIFTATIPFTMWYFYQIPIYGMLANLLVVPLAGILLGSLVALLITGSIGMFFSGSSVFFCFSRAISFISTIIIRLYEWLTEGISKLPGGLLVTGRESKQDALLYYMVLAIVLGLIRYVCKKSESTGGSFVDKRKKECAVRMKLFILIVVMLTNTSILIKIDKPEYEISALCVGQGQCFILHGKNIPTVIYDCGSSDEAGIAKYKLVPYLKSSGIDRIDVIIVSHPDTDHVSGVLELLESMPAGISVEGIIAGESSATVSSENYIRLNEYANSQGVPVYLMKAGDVIEDNRLRLECLWPGACADEIDTSDLNESSLVVSAEYTTDSGKSVKALFTGDIDVAVEKSLLNNAIGDYNYFQVPHHGSKSAAMNEFYERIAPEVLLISAGMNNRYGHPHKETMDIIKKHPGMNSFITYEKGEIDYIVKGDSARVVIYMRNS